MGKGSVGKFVRFCDDKHLPNNSLVKIISELYTFRFNKIPPSKENAQLRFNGKDWSLDLSFGINML